MCTQPGGGGRRVCPLQALDTMLVYRFRRIVLNRANAARQKINALARQAKVAPSAECTRCLKTGSLRQKSLLAYVLSSLEFRLPEIADSIFSRSILGGGSSGENYTLYMFSGGWGGGD